MTLLFTVMIEFIQYIRLLFLDIELSLNTTVEFSTYSAPPLLFWLWLLMKELLLIVAVVLTICSAAAVPLLSLKLESSSTNSLTRNTMLPLQPLSVTPLIKKYSIALSEMLAIGLLQLIVAFVAIIEK